MYLLLFLPLVISSGAKYLLIKLPEYAMDTDQDLSSGMSQDYAAWMPQIYMYCKTKHWSGWYYEHAWRHKYRCRNKQDGDKCHCQKKEMKLNRCLKVVGDRRKCKAGLCP